MLDAQAIVQEIENKLTKNARVWVAYSGGVDSTVLLHILSNSAISNAQIMAIHINHQLSPNAEHWQHHCEQIASDFGIECQSVKVDVKKQGRGIEHAARQERYKIFTGCLEKHDLLLTGHHGDDEAETFFYRVMRGAGLKGLAGIEVARPLGNGKLFRPLLDVSRENVLAYAQSFHLRWVEDESNQDATFDRNFLRTTILPLLKQRWPNASESVAKTTGWLKESSTLLDIYGIEDLNGCDLRPEKIGESVNLEKFKIFPFARQKHIVRTWVEQQGFLNSDSAVLDQLPGLLNAKEDAGPVIRWGACELRRAYGRLYLMPKFEEPDSCVGSIVWCSSEPIVLSDGSILTCNIDSNVEFQFEVRPREEGVRCQPIGRRHSQSLKKLLQEYRLPAWMRARVPLVYYQGELLAVGDVFNCHHSSFCHDISFTWEYPTNF